MENPLSNLTNLQTAAISCVHCGQCRVPMWFSKAIFGVCPVYNVEVTPKFEPFFSRGKNVILKGLLWGDLSLNAEISDIFYQCTLCGACYEFCQNAHNASIDFANHRWMDQVNVYEALRADLVAAGCGLPAHTQMNDDLIKKGNPYGRDNGEKASWTTQLDFPVKDALKESADLLYFVGCTAALTSTRGLQNIAVSTAKLFHKLGVDFAIFGAQELCCGSVALRTGNKPAFTAIAERNVELLKKAGIKKIVTSCAGCYRTLKKDYGSRLDGIELVHTVEFLWDFIQQKGISLRKLKLKTTYHDPCHLGRHLGIYAAPRELLSQISTLVEMEATREGAHCCGAGGGVKKAFPDLSLAMAKKRVEEACRTGAQALVSTCPFCFRNLGDAIDDLHAPIVIHDLVELLLEALNTHKSASKMGMQKEGMTRA